jgi:hypothetical protein
MTSRRKPRRRNHVPPDLVVHGASAEAWAKRWNIEIPEPAPCYYCEAPLTCTLPFVKGNLRGLKAAPCVCGNERGPYCVVDANGGDPFLK